MRNHLEGHTFGVITVVSFSHSDKGGNSIYNCSCKCGKIYTLSNSNIKKNKGVGCRDCYNRILSEKNFKTGKSTTRIYNIWSGILERCLNPNATAYKYYGSKGVSVCIEWTDFNKFEEWALANGYSNALSIDRINPSGDYCPLNCRWTTMLEQARNRRNTVRYNLDGEMLTLMEICNLIGCNYNTAKTRLRRGHPLRVATEKGGINAK